MELSEQPKLSGLAIPVKALATADKKLNPFPWFKEMRQTQPISFDQHRQCWDLFRYDDILAVLKNPQTFSSARPAVGAVLLGSILSMDPPKHNQMRAIVSKAFTPRSIAELAPRITQITEELLHQAKGKQQIDLVKEISTPLPVIVIAELLGVPPEDRKLFKDWSDVIAETVEDDSEATIKRFMERRGRTRQELDQYFMQVVAERRKQPRNDLITKLVEAELDGQKLQDEEIMEFCIVLLAAGNETTTNLITNAVRLFTERPELQEKLRQEPQLMETAVEEVLRFYSPILAMNRYATEDVQLNGQQIKKGQQVVTWIASANRDEQKFSDAEQFVADRSPNHHLAFGHGIHFCLGAPLARLEANIALPLILKHFHQLELVPGSDLKPIPSTFVYGVKSLPIQFKPGTTFH